MKSLATLFLALCIYHAKAQFITFTLAPGSPSANVNAQRGYASKDLNNDGNMDLIVGNAYSTQLYVFLGSGNGQFSLAPGSPILINTGPIYTAVDDYNNDNILDIATANYSSGNVTILLGTGTGSFSPALGSPISTGSLPYCIDAADFNLDGNKDLVMVNYSANNIFVLLGNGTGSFTTSSNLTFTTGGNPVHVSAGSFNSDSFPDFVVANAIGNTVSVFLGTGTGSFTTGPNLTYTVGNQPRTICMKDLNNDGFSDMVVTNALSNDITILLGSATGSFSYASGSPITTGNYPYQSVIADFDLDGIQDIITTNCTANNISVLLGNGNGTFNVAINSPLTYGNGPQPIIVSDFNNDSSPDLAFGDFMGVNITILLNKASQPCNLAANYTYTIVAAGQVSFNSSSSGTTSTTSYVWNFGDATPTATGSSTSHTYASAGTYSVTLMANNNFTPTCSSTFTQVIEVTQTVGIQKLTLESQVLVSPNPNSGHIQIKMPYFFKGAICAFYNIFGQEELRRPLTADETDLNISDFKNGTYFYRIYLSQQVVKTGQIVLNK